MNPSSADHVKPIRLECQEYMGDTTRQFHTNGMWLTLCRYGSHSRQPWHVHANPTFFLLLGGDHCDHTRAGDSIQPALSISFHPTTAPHRSEVGPSGMWGINLELSPEWLFEHHLAERDLGTLRILEGPDLGCRLARFAVEVFGSKAGHAELDLLATDLVSLFSDCGRDLERSAPAWLLRVKERIDSASAEHISISELAAESSVHPVYLCRAFRKHFRQSIGEYVGRLRIANACKLMLAGIDAGPAALDSGFCDQFYLSRAMSSDLGIRPASLKRLAKQRGSDPA